jgi:hypothetical protein
VKQDKGEKNMITEQSINENLTVHYSHTGFSLKEYSSLGDDDELLQIIVLDHNEADKLWRYLQETLINVGFYE